MSARLIDSKGQDRQSSKGQVAGKGQDSEPIGQDSKGQARDRQSS